MDADDIPDIDEMMEEANGAGDSGLCDIPEDVLEVVSPALS